MIDNAVQSTAKWRNSAECDEEGESNEDEFIARKNELLKRITRALTHEDSFEAADLMHGSLRYKTI